MAAADLHLKLAVDQAVTAIKVLLAGAAKLISLLVQGEDAAVRLQLRPGPEPFATGGDKDVVDPIVVEHGRGQYGDRSTLGEANHRDLLRRHSSGDQLLHLPTELPGMALRIGTAGPDLADHHHPRLTQSLEDQLVLVDAVPRVLGSRALLLEDTVVEIEDIASLGINLGRRLTQDLSRPHHLRITGRLRTVDSPRACQQHHRAEGHQVLGHAHGSPPSSKLI
jgi:hypothetical protein